MEAEGTVKSDIEDMMQGLEGKKTEKELAPIEEMPAEMIEEPIAPAQPAKEEAPVEPLAEETPAALPVDDIAAENERLRLLLNEMAKKNQAAPAVTPVSDATPPKAPEPSPITAPEMPTDLTHYITKEEADMLMDEPEKVMTAVLSRVVKATEERILRTMPNVVSQVAKHQLSMMKRVDQFYDDNKDLKKFEDFCILTATQIESENPGWTADQVFEETAKVARERLGLRAQVVQQESADQSVPQNPAFASAPASRKPSGGPKLNKDQEAMLDMLKEF